MMGAFWGGPEKPAAEGKDEESSWRASVPRSRVSLYDFANERFHSQLQKSPSRWRFPQVLPWLARGRYRWTTNEVLTP
jgi:hypothetical protein